jgi:hypothetical protein
MKKVHAVVLTLILITFFCCFFGYCLMKSCRRAVDLEFQEIHYLRDTEAQAAGSGGGSGSGNKSDGGKSKSGDAKSKSRSGKGSKAAKSAGIGGGGAKNDKAGSVAAPAWDNAGGAA